MNDCLNKTITLRDGRTLGYSEVGALHGKPLLHFHGGGCSRIEGSLLDGPAKRHGLRIICPDRPGTGLSTFSPGWQIVDWPLDVVELADALKLADFSISGFSGGGPFALACASKISKRITGTTLVSAIGPLAEPDMEKGISNAIISSYRTARNAPWKLYPQFLGMKIIFSEKSFKKMLRKMPEADQISISTHPEYFPVLLQNFKEGFRHVGGVIHEMRLLASPWKFDIKAIQTPIHLWHGEADRNVPPAMGRYLSRIIPHCEAHFLPGEGHYSVFLNHVDEILETCMQLS
jgi:pimeloyl-ACP methyl ester carboxylesterase